MKRWTTAVILGALILTLGACSSKYETHITSIDRATIENDNTTVKLGFLCGGLDLDSQVDVSETAAALKVTLRVRSRKGSTIATGEPCEVTIKLRSPLGSRSLLDNTGKSIPIGPESPPVRKPFPVTKVAFDK